MSERRGSFYLSHSAPTSPDISDTLNAMYADSSQESGFGLCGAPLPNTSLFSRVKRRLSLRGRGSFRRRKSSQTSLHSLSPLDLEGLFTEVGRKLSNSSRDDLCNFQLDAETEQLYRGLLRSVVHPLGAPDSTIGLRPGDLADHLREVFDLDRDEHEVYIKEELVQKPADLRLHVTVSEALGLRPQDSTSVSDPYCILSIVSPLKHGTRSPKSSPKNSPKTSPKTRRKSSTWSGGFVENGDVRQTQTGKGGINPKWNEQFELDVYDHSVDELHVYVWDQSKDAPSLGLPSIPSALDKTTGLKNIFRHIRQNVEHGKTGRDFLGVVVTPLREIPANGVEKWFEMSDRCKVTGKMKPAGKIKLRFYMSYREIQTVHVDTVDSCLPPRMDYSAIEEYFHSLQQMFRHAVKVQHLMTQSPSLVPQQIDGTLTTQKRRIMDLFAVSHNISKLSQAVLQLIIMLQWSIGHENSHITDLAVHKSVETVQMTWLTMQMGRGDVQQKMPLTDTEISMFRSAASNYFSQCLSQLDGLPALFPPSVDAVTVLKSKIGVLIQLQELELWDENSKPNKELTALLLKKIQMETAEWVDEHLSSVCADETIKDTVLPEITSLTDIVLTTTAHLTPICMIRQFFTTVDLNYYRTISFALESKISKKSHDLMQQMDKYQVRYHKYTININSSSRVSLKLYFALRKLFQTARDHINPREMFKLTISKYQSWFEEALVFWLQTFRTECIGRMEKALEIDKDMVLVTSLVKYSNSSVDVLSCFSKITEEWRQIEYNDADSVLMGVTKITDLICDGSRQYADKIHCILERNCYYDNNEGQFDVTDRLCITLNNIEHVRQYLNELPQQLDWPAVVEGGSMKHGSVEVGQQALMTLRRLTKTAHGDMLMKSLLLVNKITERMKIEIQKYTQQFTTIEPEKLSSIDALMHYMSSNTKTLNERLMSTIYPVFIEHLWLTVVTCFDEQLMIGQSMEYYLTMRRHVRSLCMYFVRGGVEEDKVNMFICDSFTTRLELNCLPSEDLILHYYKDLADNMGTPVDYYGHLALKTAYMEETRGKVTIFVKVLRASDLPGLDPNGLSDPYVKVSLQPPFMFPHHKAHRTKVMDKTLHPVFNATFQFTNIPKEYLTIPGAVLVLSVLDHDNFGLDDFAGEIILHLSSIQPIGIHESVNSLQVVMMPVKRPTNQKGAFQVLRERSSWDRISKWFVTERLRFIDNQPSRTDRPNTKTSIFSFFNNWATAAT